MTKKRFLLALLVLCVLLPPAVFAATEEKGDDGKGPSGLPLPRFVSLREDEVNMRTGPGTRYPIEWVFTEKGLPVEITAEYDVWRRVRDPDGDEGWIHKSQLSGRRDAIVTGGAHDLLGDSDAKAAIVAHLQMGAVGRLLSCGKLWCRLEFNGTKGYLPKSQFWGAYPDETFD